MTKTEWVSDLFAERLSSLADLHAALTDGLGSTADAERTIATVRLLASELLMTAQEACETLTGTPGLLFSEDFLRAGEPV